MTLISAGDALGGLAVLEKRITWVKCPFCDDEVSRLRPCVYWSPSEQKSYVCVECAETVKGLTFLAVNYPVPGVDVIRELLPLYRRLSPKFANEYSYKAHVVYGGFGFMVWPKGGKLFALEDGKSPDMEKAYNNSFQVWFALTKLFQEGKEEQPLIPRKGDRRSSWKI